MLSLLWLASPFGAAGFSGDLSTPILPSRETFSVESNSPKMSFAIVRITRTLVYDEHALDGGPLPEIDPDTLRVVLDYDMRGQDTRPLVRTYTIKVAVPSDRPRSWDANLGDDYRLLLITRGFTGDAKGIKIDGRVKSNYQLQLEDNKPPMGPNSFGFSVSAVGERSAIQVMNDEAPGRIFREFDETVIEAVTDRPPDLPTVGIDETEDVQQRRWIEWGVIRKRGLQ